MTGPRWTSYPALDVAALDVVTSVPAHNLAEGTSEHVLVPREMIERLRDELQDKWPNVVNLVYLERRRAS